jgi:poly(3-hydroxybutyrate) depolymerase
MLPRMQRISIHRLGGVIAVCFALAIPAAHVEAQTIDDSIAPGRNYDKAQFRLWVPRDPGKLRAVLVLVPGSNGDGRAMAEDTTWQNFAARNKLAIVACRFTDKPHEQNFIEDYVNVSQGSGQALLDGLSHLAARAGHPEIASAPLLFWGMSAGGEFNYEFAAWKPERVVAFVVNKGGIYYSALTPRATREVPALLFIGGKDLESRVNTITGLFAVNRRGGALWALTEEPGAAHVVGRSRDMSIIFFDEVLPLRLGEAAGTLKPLAESAGFIGDFKSKTTRAVADSATPNYPTAWLPTARVARAWQAMLTEKPFD